MAQEEFYEEHHIVWEGIALRIRWTPIKFGGIIAHLELFAEGKQRLPMTKTGYRSHFIQREEVEDYGGAVAYATAWLDHEAQSREWKRYVEDSKQLSLF